MSSNTVANRVGAQNNQLRTRGGLGAKSVPHRLINVLGIQAALGAARTRRELLLSHMMLLIQRMIVSMKTTLHFTCKIYLAN